MKTPHRAIRPDAQAFDEIRITTVPRYKTSGLSGDEWRISARVQFFRKGIVVHESGGARDVETACRFLAYDHARACDDGNAYFAGIDDFCDQEGCAEQATVTYRLKEEFARKRPTEWHGPPRVETHRRFCRRHSRRGDCGFEDSDANYELVAGEPGGPPLTDVRESARVVVDVGDPEDLTPELIRDAVRKARAEDGA